MEDSKPSKSTDVQADERGNFASLDTQAPKTAQEDAKVQDIDANDSEAETEILSISRRQTPKKPPGNDLIDQDTRDTDTITLGRAHTAREVLSLPSSPRKRKVHDSVRQNMRHGGPASSDDEEEDVVVRPTRVKRARKTPKEGVASGDDGRNASDGESRHASVFYHHLPATTSSNSTFT